MNGRENVLRQGLGGVRAGPGGCTVDVLVSLSVIPWRSLILKPAVWVLLIKNRGFGVSPECERPCYHYLAAGSILSK